MLFEAGAIDDFSYVEETPDPTSFAEHLAIFSGARGDLLGQFEFGVAGESLAEVARRIERTVRLLGMEGDFPDHAGLLRWRDKDARRYGEVANALIEWPEREVIAWMELSANPGTPERPVYRYYLTRNRNLIAVRDQGEGRKELFPIRTEETPHASIPARENPFSGIH